MSLFRLFEGERRDNLNNPAVPLTSTALLDMLGGTRVDSGMHVSERSSLGMSAAYRCVSLISSVSAALPIKTYKAGTKDTAVSTLLANPHPDLTPYDLWKLSYCHRCLWGNSYQQKIRSSNGRIQSLWPITPDRVRVGRVRPSDLNQSGKIFEVTDDWGTRLPFTSREILHIPGLGYDGTCGVSPIRIAAQAIGLSLAAESYAARLFGSGNLLSGILQTEQRLKQEDADRLQARWRSMLGGLDRAHDVAVLDSGAKFQNMTMPSKDAEMLESRTFQVSELSRFFGVPPFLMMEQQKSTSWGTGLEQQAIGWVKFDLHSQWLAPTEQRITKEITGNNIEAKYSIEGLLRGDSQARAEFYRVMREIGAYSADDIRDLEDLQPIPGGVGKIYLQPMNFVPLGTQPAEQSPLSTDPGADDGPPPVPAKLGDPATNGAGKH